MSEDAVLLGRGAILTDDDLEVAGHLRVLEELVLEGVCQVGALNMFEESQGVSTVTSASTVLDLDEGLGVGLVS